MVLKSFGQSARQARRAYESFVAKAMGISAVTLSNAVSLGSELSEVDKIQQQLLDN